MKLINWLLQWTIIRKRKFIELVKDRDYLYQDTKDLQHSITMLSKRNIELGIKLGNLKRK